MHCYETRDRETTGLRDTEQLCISVIPHRLGSTLSTYYQIQIRSSAPSPKAFKDRLKATLLSEAFYSRDEFLAHE